MRFNVGWRVVWRIYVAELACICNTMPSHCAPLLLLLQISSTCTVTDGDTNHLDAISTHSATEVVTAMPCCSTSTG